MKWLPYENFYIDTNLKPDAAQAALKTEVGPDPGSPFRKIFSQRTESYFLGDVDYGTFQIRRQTYYRNSFLPRITGTIEPYIGGSRVRVKMKPDMLVIIFMCMWMGFAALGGIVMISVGSKTNLDSVSLIPFGMFLFGYLLMMGAFKFESIEATRKLAEIFQGGIEEA